MNADLLRYSCQVALPGFGEVAQQRLQHAKVLIVGAGGLGCPAAQYLAAAGAGTLGIADFDTVSISNLHRQILYTPQDKGQQKATVACLRLKQQNPGIKLVPHLVRITSENVMNLFAKYDIIVDGTDNFETRYLINDAAVLSGKPVVYGAIYQYEGQVAVWNVKNIDGSRSPNYRDLFPEVNASQIPNCADGGVIPTLAGIIGCMQANEVIKYITQTGELLAGKVLIFDAQTMQSRIIKIDTQTRTRITTIPQTAPVSVISADALKIGLEKGTYQLFDVRTLQERDLFDIGGIHIPLDELEDDLELFSHGKPKVIYCATGKRSAEAVKLIKKAFPDTEIYSLDKGLKEWRLSEPEFKELPN